MQKFKNNEARPKFTGSYKKKACSCCSLVSSLYILGSSEMIWRRFSFPSGAEGELVHLGGIGGVENSEIEIASKSLLITPQCTKMTQGSSNP